MLCYKRNEQEKKRTYEERVREIEHGSFAPLIVVSISGGMGPIATTVYKRMASLIAENYNNPYSSTLFLAKMQAEFLLIAICNNVRLEVLLSQTNKHTVLPRQNSGETCLAEPKPGDLQLAEVSRSLNLWRFIIGGNIAIDIGNNAGDL